jgi:hypothetical protein
LQCLASNNSQGKQGSCASVEFCPASTILSVCGPLRYLPSVKAVYLPTSTLTPNSHQTITNKPEPKALQPIYIRPSKDILFIPSLDQLDIPAFLSRPENHEIRHLGTLKPFFTMLVSVAQITDVFQPSLVSTAHKTPNWTLLRDLSLQTLYVFDRVSIPQDQRLSDEMSVLVDPTGRLGMAAPMENVCFRWYVKEAARCFMEVLRRKGLMGREWVPPRFIGTEWKVR